MYTNSHPTILLYSTTTLSILFVRTFALHCTAIAIFLEAFVPLVEPSLDFSFDSHIFRMIMMGVVLAPVSTHVHRIEDIEKNDMKRRKIQTVTRDFVLNPNVICSTLSHSHDPDSWLTLLCLPVSCRQQVRTAVGSQ